jgi:hypothetical protein
MKGAGAIIAAAAGLLFLIEVAPVQAQQRLFPNMGVGKRERVPACQENPLYGMYRRQYYGYYPTCWRQFPPGWGCPSSETPNSAQVVEEIRKEIEAREKEASGEDDAPTAPDFGGGDRPGGAGGGRAEPPVPLPGTGPSPFDMPEGPPATPPGADPLPPPAPGDAPGFTDRPGGPAAPALTPPDDAPLVPPLDPGPPPVAAPGGTGAQPPPIADQLNPPRRTLIGGLVDNFRSMRRR